MARSNLSKQSYSLIKWVGGKARLVPSLLEHLPEDVESRRHVELFAGGLSLFFARRPHSALLSDTNSHLIAMYGTVRAGPDEVIRLLKQHEAEHSKEHYYAVREAFNKRTGTPAAQAARFIYMNRTCYNGMFRVNKAGGFNVPFGDYVRPNIVNEPRVRECSLALRQAELANLDYKKVASQVRANDFVYLDPPYAPLKADSYVSYSTSGFTMDDHADVARVFAEMDERGAKLMLNNSDTAAVRKLYANFRLDTVQTPRSVSRNMDQRGKVSELLVRNY